MLKSICLTPLYRVYSGVNLQIAACIWSHKSLEYEDGGGVTDVVVVGVIGSLFSMYT